MKRFLGVLAALWVSAVAVGAVAATEARYQGEEYCSDFPAWSNGSWLGQFHPWHQQHYINVFGRDAACAAWANDQRNSAIAGLQADGYTVVAPEAATAPSATRPTEREIVDYFLEVGLGTEYGNASPVVRKWRTDLTIEVEMPEAPHAGDWQHLHEVIADLNDLLEPISVRLVSSGGNVRIRFAPESEFPELLPSYVPGNEGFFHVWWDGRGSIYRAEILISTTVIDSGRRAHLIREELTQALGLMRDSRIYPDSIFYQGKSSVGRYSAIDSEVIRFLYRDDVHVGMTRSDILALAAARES